MGDRASAQRWDKECGACGYRNGFVIPELRNFLEKHRPITILDVGAASGYIARQCASAAPDSKWTLLDADQHRLDLAKELCTGNFTFALGSVFDISLPTYDLVLLSNTLLEFELSDERLTRLARLANPSGWIVVVLPDTSADVAHETRSGNDVLDAYARGNLRLNKQDKFTGEPYPFVAHRPIDIVCALLAKGFSLREAKQSANDGAFFLAFQAHAEAG